MAEHWLSDIGNFLKVTNAVMGGEVYLYEMPDDVNRGVLVIPPMGGLPIDPDLPRYFKATFDVVVRADHPKVARDELAAIVPLLTLGRAVWTNMTINYCRPLNTPQVFPKSEAGHYEAAVTFMICFTDARI